MLIQGMDLLLVLVEVCPPQLQFIAVCICGALLKRVSQVLEGDCGVPHRAPSWHPAVLCSLRTRERLWDLLLKDNQEQMPGSSGILQCEELYFPSLHRRGVVLFCCFFNLGALGLFSAAVVVLSIVCFIWNCLLFLFSSNPHL